MRGEVGLVSRNVIIRGTVQDNWGCRILIPGYHQSIGNKRIDGNIHLKGVLIQNCGQRDTENAALDFNSFLYTHLTLPSIIILFIWLVS